MKKLICILFLSATISTATFASININPVTPDIKPFWYLSDTPNRPAPSPAPRPRAPKHHSPHRDVSDSFFEFFFFVFWDLFWEFAYESNWYVIYDDYPYAKSDFYIQYQSLFDEITTPVVEKYDRYDAGINTQYGVNTGIVSTTARFDGYIFKFFGPVVEATNYFSLIQTLPYLGNVKIGLELACFQTFVFSWKWNFDWVLYYGPINVNGINYGFTINSYPVKPLVIEYRCNITDFLFQFADNNDYYYRNYILESYLEVGLMLDNTPWEVYAAWNYRMDGLLQAADNCAGIGVKYFF